MAFPSFLTQKLVFIVGLFPAVLVVGCGDATEEDVCLPGVTEACACPGRSTPGAQSCNSDGSGFGGCSCPEGGRSQNFSSEANANQPSSSSNDLDASPSDNESQTNVPATPDATDSKDDTAPEKQSDAGIPPADLVPINEPPPPSNTPPELVCLGPGELACDLQNVCCTGSSCVAEGTGSVCASNCSSGADCNSQCCAPLQGGTLVCAPSEFCPAVSQSCSSNADCPSLCCVSVDGSSSVCASAALCEPPVTVGCPELVVLGDDGEFLGNASSSGFDADSVCNEFGQYGSEFAANSIFNTFGTYGGEFSILGAYNEFTVSPPVLFCRTTNSSFGRVSKNSTLFDAIDPDQLCATLDASGF